MARPWNFDFFFVIRVHYKNETSCAQVSFWSIRPLEGYRRKTGPSEAESDSSSGYNTCFVRILQILFLVCDKFYFIPSIGRLSRRPRNQCFSAAQRALVRLWSGSSGIRAPYWPPAESGGNGGALTARRQVAQCIDKWRTLRDGAAAESAKHQPIASSPQQVKAFRDVLYSVCDVVASYRILFWILFNNNIL